MGKTYPEAICRYIFMARIERKEYNALPFLQLPGVAKIHLPEA
jgi:hypothetical protein